METETNKEYASKGVAGTGLGLGIAGTALGLLPGLLNGGLNIGGFGGWNNPQTAMAGAGLAQNEIGKLRSDIAKLESEKYTDGKVQELFNNIYKENKELASFLANVDKRIASIETAGPLREQIVEGKIALVAQQANCCCTSLTAQVNALQATLANITKTVVPNASVCPGWGNVTITPAAATTATT